MRDLQRKYEKMRRNLLLELEEGEAGVMKGRRRRKRRRKRMRRRRRRRRRRLLQKTQLCGKRNTGNNKKKVHFSHLENKSILQTQTANELNDLKHLGDFVEGRTKKPSFHGSCLSCAVDNNNNDAFQFGVEERIQSSNTSSKERLQDATWSAINNMVEIVINNSTF